MNLEIEFYVFQFEYLQFKEFFSEKFSLIGFGFGQINSQLFWSDQLCEDINHATAICCCTSVFAYYDNRLSLKVSSLMLQHIHMHIRLYMGPSSVQWAASR